MLHALVEQPQVLFAAMGSQCQEHSYSAAIFAATQK